MAVFKRSAKQLTARNFATQKIREKRYNVGLEILWIGDIRCKEGISLQGRSTV